MIKENKLIVKILSVLVIVSILLSLVCLVCSADSGQIGNSLNDNMDGADLYTSPPADHGIPFDVTYFGFANGITSVGALSNNYTFNNFGVTYPPIHAEASYGIDQYPRIEQIARPGVSYFDNTLTDIFGNIGAYYYSIDIPNNHWSNDNINYSYESYIIPRNVSYSLRSAIYQDFSSNLEEAILASNGNLITDDTAVASSVKWSYHGELSLDLLTRLDEDDNPIYCPWSLTNFCLSPLETQGKQAYYDFKIKGYSVVNGVKQYSTYHFTSDSNNPTYYRDLNDYFLVTEDDIDYSDAYLMVNSIGYYFDSAYGLVTDRVEFCIADFFTFERDNLNFDVLTDFEVYFGEKYYSANRHFVSYYDKYESYPIIGTRVKYYNISPYTQDVHNSYIDNYLLHPVDDGSDFSLNWLGQTIGGVFDVDLFGSFGLGDILFVVIGIGIFIAILKIFVGG